MLTVDENSFNRLKKILSIEKDMRTRLDLEYLFKNLKFEFIKNLFQKFGEIIAFTFLKSINWKEYKTGEFIYKSGEYANHCYILLKGTIDYCQPLSTSKAIIKSLLKANRNKAKVEFSVINTITEGNLFGEAEIADRKNRSFTARCTSDCIVGEMSKQDYINIFENTKRLELNEELKFLNSTQLLKDSNGNNVRKFLLELTKRSFKHSDLVIKQGEAVDHLLIVRKGQFEIIYKHKDKFKCDYNSKYLNDENGRFTSHRVYELKDEVNMIEQHKVDIVRLYRC